MRRQEREIKDIKIMEDIIEKAYFCRLGLSDSGRPYIVPLCFGYRDGVFYFHSALEGKKIEIIKRNNHVCIELDTDSKLIPGPKACSFALAYRSIMAFGQASLITEAEEKQRALDIIMEHYTDGAWSYDDSVVERTAVVKVEIDSMTGKQSRIS
ncbi:MAG: pyridoxamine 5'-phosphate oxidase family protein [Deltaproteobacteria bacterium]|nr:pyridoxamine 5'-phosphate oxidase family protein [Deltaproteobacteria bacterium]